MRSWFPWVLAALVLGAVGCGDEDEGATAAARARLAEGCALDSNCAAPLVCAFERCHIQCTADRDCPASDRCVRGGKGGVCQLADERECSRNTDCGEPLVCGPDDQCRDQCRFERDCFEGQVCQQGVCAKPEELDVSGKLPSDQPGVPCASREDCPPGLVCRNGACQFECKVDRDCPEKFLCSNGFCAAIAVNEPSCVPGNQRACPCAAGGIGITTCKLDGSGFEPECQGCAVAGAGGEAGASGSSGQSGAGQGGVGAGGEAGQGGEGGAGQGGAGGAGQGGAGQAGNDAGSGGAGAGQGGTDAGGAGQGGAGQAGSDSAGQGGAGVGGCGNGVVDPGEACDGAAPAGQDCVALLGSGALGAVVCGPGCQLDASACSLCGDGIAQGTEGCDGTDFGGADCASELGNPNAVGDLSCSGVCEISAVGCSVPQVCGDSVIDPGEVCDGTVFGGRTCTTELGQGWAGPLTCAPDCASVDTSSCAQTCGSNATVDPGEDCEYAIGTAVTCEDLGLGAGPVSCRPDCTFETALCNTVVASVQQPLPAAVPGAFQMLLAGDGKSLLFSTGNDEMDVNDTDANGKSDVFRYDLSGFVKKSADPKLQRLSVSASGGDADGDSEVLGASYDGSRVIFRSKASNLVTGKGIPVNNAIWHLYLRDLSGNTTTLLDVTTAGQASSTGVIEASLAEDGQFIAFTSSAPSLVAGDSGSPVAVPFVLDLSSSAIERLPSGNAADFSENAQHVRISADGRYVFFDTMQGDITPTQNAVLRFDRQTSSYLDISQLAVPSSQGNPFFLIGISGDGGLAAFSHTNYNVPPRMEAVYLYNASTGEAAATSIKPRCFEGPENVCAEADDYFAPDNIWLARDGQTAVHKGLDPSGSVEFLLHAGAPPQLLLATFQGESIGSGGPVTLTVTKEGKRIFAVRSAVSVLSSDSNPNLPDVYVF